METLTGFEVVRFAPSGNLTATRTDEGLGTVDVRFCEFGNWYRIASFFEGEFMETVERGAFAKTIQESGSRVRALFDHGFDPSIGDKVLGTISDLREDPDAAVGVVELFDTSYTRDLLPGLEAGVYGASMRMVVLRDEWNDAPEPSDYNPKAIPERRIKEVRLLEFGPVTFPANPNTSAKPRSTTDEFYERLRSRDPQRVESVARAARSFAPSHDASAAISNETPAPATSHPEGLTPAQRREAFLNNRKGD